MRSFVVLSLLGGCWVSGDEVQAIIDGDSSELTVDRLEPSHGSDAGGTIEVLGSGFDDSVEVRIGAELATLIRAETNRVVVEVPAGLGEGPLPVQVSGANGFVELDPGYTVWRDATDQYAMFGYLNHQQYQGEYWGGAAPETGFALMLGPGSTKSWHTQSRPDMGSCVENYSGGTPPDYYIPVGDVSLRFDGGPEWDLVMYTEDETVLTPGDPGDLSFLESGVPATTLFSEGSSTFPPLDLDLTPAVDAFDVTEPVMDGSELGSMARSGWIRWTAGDADAVQIDFIRVDFASSTTQQFITCVTADTGSFQAPSSMFTDWPTDGSQYVVINVIKAGWIESELPHNHGLNSFEARWAVAGAIVPS